MYRENKYLKYTGSYDARFDILRINNKSADSFFYEDFDSNILLMIDDENHEVIGAQILDFLKDDNVIHSIEKLLYTNLRKAIIKIYKYHIDGITEID